MNNEAYQHVIDWCEANKENVNVKGQRDHVMLNLNNWIKGQFEKDKDHKFCKQCGCVYFQDLERNECFHCDFWIKRLGKYVSQKTSNKMMLVIDGHIYSDAGATHPSQSKRYNGFGGSVFTIKLKETGEVWTTNNLWHGGDIPPSFYEKMPDNAEFIKEKEVDYQEMFK